MSADFLRGALWLASWIIGLFFFRFWRMTADRLFLLFAIAFWVFGVEAIAHSLMTPVVETQHYLFLLRLAGFGLIILGVIDKNRRSTA